MINRFAKRMSAWKVKNECLRAKLTHFLPVIISFPAVFIGTAAMYVNRIEMYIWLQHLIFFIVAGIVSIVLTFYKQDKNLLKPTNYLIVLLLASLLLTLVSQGIDGVHRWIEIGGIRINPAMVVLPTLLLFTWKVSLKSNIMAGTLAFVVTTILLFQPDASQVTGFALGTILLLIKSGGRKSVTVVFTLILLVLITASWLYLDHLAAVVYVENILSLVSKMGGIWYLLGIFSLIMLVVPFILFPPKGYAAPSISIGLYFMLLLIVTQIGNFPVLLMGYGISPIVGYMIAMTWYARVKNVVITGDKNSV